MHPKQLHPEHRVGCWPCFSTAAHPSFTRQKETTKRETPQEFLPLTTNLSILQESRKVSQFSSTSTEVFRNTFLIYALIFLKGIGKGKGVPVGSRLTCPENKPAAASLSFYVCKVKCLWTECFLRYAVLTGRRKSLLEKLTYVKAFLNSTCTVTSCF